MKRAASQPLFQTTQRRIVALLSCDTSQYEGEEAQDAVLSMQEKLRHMGVSKKDLFLRINPTSYALDAAITVITDKLEKNDIFLFYFCGYCDNTETRFIRDSLSYKWEREPKREYSNYFFLSSDERFNLDYQLDAIGKKIQVRDVTFVCLFDCAHPCPSSDERRLKFGPTNMPMNAIVVWSDYAPKKDEKARERLGLLTKFLCEHLGQNKSIEGLAKEARVSCQFHGLEVGQVSSLVSVVKL